MKLPSIDSEYPPSECWDSSRGWIAKRALHNCWAPFAAQRICCWPPPRPWRTSLLGRRFSDGIFALLSTWRGIWSRRQALRAACANRISPPPARPWRRNPQAKEWRGRGRSRAPANPRWDCLVRRPSPFPANWQMVTDLCFVFANARLCVRERMYCIDNILIFKTRN